MLDAGELREHILVLAKGDDASQRQTLHSLRQVEPSEWAAVPPSVLQSLVESLQQQLLGGTKSPFIHKEIATILGNMAPGSRAALPQLLLLLQDGNPDSVREAVVKGLGQFGEAA